MIKVLFVCLGNICRSPMAEAIFNARVRELGLENELSSDSCGTANYHIGSQPDQRTVNVVKGHHMPINHFCRQLTRNDIDDFDYIMAMDASNYQNILFFARGGNEHKVLMMRSFDSQSVEEEVPDPYYGSIKDFQEVFEILDQCISGFIDHLREKHSL